MKKLLATVIASAALLSPVAQADLTEDLQNICTIVKNNDKGELRKKMRGVKDDYRMRLGDFYEGVSCGGQSLIRYAMANGANDVGAYMVGQMGKSDLSKPEGDGMTLQQWADSNGYLASETGKELLDRLN
ncbi:DUF3718 domain-containing protein [Pseudobowmanella zhangzhouensis]|uniref:DUF3718 domain-containing protein n=1 Tax=Pseudobowmanella zhangzhouensis TaxID=1537679 RepID=A0ABW1XIM5_9ALTE